MSKFVTNRKRSQWLWSLLFAVLANAAGTLPAPAQDVEVLQVRPNLYMIAGAGGNIAVQVGPIGAILVNTGTEAMSDKVLAAVAKLTSLPIRYIVNTSDAADFVGGNARLSKAGQTVLGGLAANPGVSKEVITNAGAASVLAHENVLTRMSAPTGAKAPFPESWWPTKTYSGKGYSLCLNGEGVRFSTSRPRIPVEAVLGGAETMYPEFRTKLKDKYLPPE